MGITWDDPDIEALKVLWAKGDSAELISIAFGRRYSRNAVVGKANRLGLEPRDTRARSSRIITAQNPPKIRLMKIEPGDPGPAPQGPLNDWPPSNSCLWMDGSIRDAEWRFCAAPGTPFCAWHSAKVYVPPRPAKP